ncbi:uncharacterized protein LOC125486563 isoform X2 [Rhincodon typus]|uniref:uncharacterized protein LOC125486563 isoform X2 n=1 Tax=Rhincodon typus TaxID=259920 RepID=UPI00202ED7BE|nr:uncharacterized protein LOC125486563 isoform X2 [Rhincodon typus]
MVTVPGCLVYSTATRSQLLKEELMKKKRSKPSNHPTRSKEAPVPEIPPEAQSPGYKRVKRYSTISEAKQRSSQTPIYEPGMNA